jgi:hypothetical protein
MKIDNYNLPDFYVLAPGKSGTTSLYKYMKTYAKDIYLPEQKELNFLAFRNISSMNNFSDSITKDELYFKLFKEKEKYISGDISPVNFHFYKNTVSTIKDIYQEKEKDLKYIVILRNPIDRLWSSYHMFANIWDHLPFEEAIKKETINERLKNGRLHDIGGGGKAYFLNYIENTLLYDNLEYFLKHLNKDNFRFYLFEDLFNKRVETFKNISDLLDIDDAWVDDIKDLNIKTGSTTNIKFAPIYNFFVKTNKFKDILKQTSFYKNNSDKIKQIKQSIYSHKIFHGKRELLTQEMRKELYFKYYKEDIEKLEKLIDKDLSHWKY